MNATEYSGPFKERSSRVLRQRNLTGSWQIRCDACGYRTRWYTTAAEAVRRFANS